MELTPTLWEGVIAGGVTVATAVLKRSDNKVNETLESLKQSHDKVASAISEVKLDAEKHKLYAEQRYVKDSTLVRLYEQMEKGFSEIRQDIKSLIKEKHENR